LHWRHLRDVYHLGVLSAYGSTVIVAVGAAICIAIATGAVDVVKALSVK
jgi:hypothetical protein